MATPQQMETQRRLHEAWNVCAQAERKFQQDAAKFNMESARDDARSHNYMKGLLYTHQQNQIKFNELMNKSREIAAWKEQIQSAAMANGLGMPRTVTLQEDVQGWFNAGCPRSGYRTYH